MKAVFLDAVERSDSERSAFVTEACAGDEELRQEVQSLLASDAAAGSFGETPAAALLAPFAPPGSGMSPRLQAGERLDGYEITGFLGAGGMGEVYRARDTRLGRDVAIKIVAGSSTDPAARLRLVREARHAATLTHRNICTIHEVEASGDLPYIVMEYVAGRSLADVVREAVPGPAAAVEYGIQIADAVAHAHERGIIHCDLKSSNIVIAPEGRAIVLDFGLARRLPGSATAPGSQSLPSAQHAPAGTLSYMAPEVLTGSPADARSDVWAIGVLLYEMASGRLPFQGRTPYETSSAIIGEAPPALPWGVPLALRLLIEQCLSKDPAHRYGNAHEVRHALEEIRQRDSAAVRRGLVRVVRRAAPAAAGLALLGVAAAAAFLWLPDRLRGRVPDTVRTIAVLPLDNGEATPGDRYFADGISDALIAQLGASGAVRVISRASAQRLTGSARSPREMAAALGADALLEGAIRRAEGRVELHLQLTDPVSGRRLWTEQLAQSEAEVLVLQAAAVSSLARALRATLPAHAQERLLMVRTVNPAAYEQYLKGRYHWNQRTHASLQIALEHLTRAVAIDETFAPAHAAIADCYNQLGTVIVGGGPPREHRRRAAAAAIKALQIDAGSAEAHAALGYVRHYEWQWDEAEREFRRAIELNPSYALVRLWYGNLLMSRGRFDEALREVYAARELDPFSLITNTNVGWILFQAGRDEEAVAQLTTTLGLDGDYPQAHWRIAGPLWSLGRFDEALAHARRFAELSNRSPSSVALLSELNARAGNRAAAQALLDELLVMARRQYVPAGVMALAQVALGDVDATLASLHQAYDEGSNAIAYLAVEPAYAPLRADPRFRALLARAGLP